MLRSLDEATVELLRERAGVETDAGVKKEIETGLALAALDGADSTARLAAIATLSQRARARMCGTGWRRCSSKSPTAASPKATQTVRRAAADGA